MMKNVSKTIAIALTTIGIQFSASAESPFSYTFLDVGYSFTQIDHVLLPETLDLHGAEATLSLELVEHFFIFGGGGWATGDVDILGIGVDTEQVTYRAGAGGYIPLGGKVDLVGSASWNYADVTAEAGGFESSADADAIVGGLGVRVHLADTLELNAGVQGVFGLSLIHI